MTRRGGSWLRAIVGLGLLALVCASIDWREEGRILRHVAWGWVWAAIGLHVLNRFLSVVKWQVLLQAKELTYPFGELLRIIWISNFFGHFLPSAVGGDSLRMWQVARKNERAPEAVSTVFVERLTGATSLALLAVLGGFWSATRWGEHAIIVALLVPVAILFAALLLIWTAPGAWLLDWVIARFRWMPGYQFFIKAQEAVHSFRHHPRQVGLSLLISGAVQLNRVLAVYALARAMDATLFFGEALVLVPSALFIAMLPLTVGGLGLHEGAFVVLLGFADIGKSTAFAIALLSRLATLSSNLPGAAFFLLEGLGRRTHARQARGQEEPARRLRVLWLADRIGYGSFLHGVGWYYLTMAPSLKGVQVVPAVLRSTNGLSCGFTRHALPLLEFHRGVFDPRLWWALTRVIRAERIDVLHVHGYGAGVIGRIVGWALRRPVIVHQHDSVRQPWYVRAADRLLSRLTAHAIAVSESVRTFCVTARFLPGDRVSAIPLAVRDIVPLSGQERAALRNGVAADARLIGCITRFHPVKGVEYLLKAMPDVVKAIPNAHCILWGDGPLRAELERLARRLGVAQHVRFAGYHADASRYLAALECFALPSLSEGFPLALLEAMRAGCPIVATRVGGVPELVREGREALLVPSRDAASLASAIIRVLTDRALARGLGRAAREAGGCYTVNRHAALLQEVYRSVVGRPEGRGNAGPVQEAPAATGCARYPAP